MSAPDWLNVLGFLWLDYTDFANTEYFKIQWLDDKMESKQWVLLNHSFCATHTCRIYKIGMIMPASLFMPKDKKKKKKNMFLV